MKNKKINLIDLPIFKCTIQICCFTLQKQTHNLSKYKSSNSMLNQLFSIYYFACHYAVELYCGNVSNKYQRLIRLIFGKQNA